MNNIKVSIVVPVYNCEKYLNRCIDSLVQQTYKNIEIILVDDGSTDSSGQICDKYKTDDERIKVFHIANSGSAEARNYGLDRASGKYIMFVDSDDYIELNSVGCFVNEAERNNLDIIAGKYIVVDEKQNILDKSSKKILSNNSSYEIFSGEKFLVTNGFFPVLWLYFYSLEYLRKINLKLRTFQNNGCYEDTEFVIKALVKAKRIKMMDLPFYYYVQRDDSQKERKEESLSYNLLDVADELEKVEKFLNTESCKVFFQKYIDILYVQAVHRIIYLNCSTKIFRDKKFINKIFSKLRKSPNKKYRIIAYVLKLHMMTIYSYLYKIRMSLKGYK